jgi:outer membrane receptor protein involved in Fe transport
MKKLYLLLTVAPLAIAMPVQAKANSADATAKADSVLESSSKGASATPKPVLSDMVTTGVARGRDRLDSATSTSSIKEAEIAKLGALNLGEIIRNIPGMRVESNGGEVNSNYTIRGLPLASTGGKFVQLQEDGLPVVEFGDIINGASDTFIRPGLGLSAVEAIRGGSASTFTSNAPGGVINMISKNGETEGGSVQGTAGVNYDSYRMDFDYGAHISETLRFHVDGFFRTGEGIRHTGYNATKGGQFRFNLTKEFASGYIRLYGKVIDERSPSYDLYPVAVTGSDANPVYTGVANFDVGRDALLSKYIPTVTTLDSNNRPVTDPIQDGIRTKVKSIGFEAVFNIGEWNVSERFRYSDISGHYTTLRMSTAMPAGSLAAAFGGPGATLSFATGPNAGQSIGNPLTLNGNGLATLTLPWDNTINSFSDMTNDLRISRVWNVGEGELTTTAGFYKSLQTIDDTINYSLIFTDVLGNGQTSKLNLTTARGIPLTENGVFAYGIDPLATGWRRAFNVDYGVNAPYGSVNYHIGKLSIGASVRYDYGTGKGVLFGSALGGGRVGTAAVDVNGNGVISFPERSTSVLPLGSPGPLDYKYHYLSYSTGINYRVAESLAVFARYSRGGHANADRALYSPVFDSGTGALLQPNALIEKVKQAEVGVKYRQSNLTLNLTGFWAKATDHNVPRIDREYRAVGLEFEGGYHVGPFSLTAGATYTDAKIVADAFDATTVGNRPRQQAKLIFQATPQVNFKQFTVGANIIGTGDRFAQDANKLIMPGFIITNLFTQVRPLPQVTLALNVNNLFDVEGYTEVTQATIPASGVVSARPIFGRTVTTSLRFDF